MTKPPARVVHDDLLDGLRGIAALMVAWGHAVFLNYIAPGVNIPEWLRMTDVGHAGVLIFFALSGYVVGWTNQKPFTASAVRDYAKRRAVRLAPIYYAAIALSLAVVLFTGRAERPGAFVTALFGLQNFSPYFSLNLPPLLVNTPLWSLNYEVLYYAAFVLLWRFKPGPWIVFAPGVIAGVLGWFLPGQMPLFLASYGCGWVFWAFGWFLSRQPVAERNQVVNYSVGSALLLLVAGQRFDGLARILNALGCYCKDSGMIGLNDFGRLPAVALVLAALTGRRLPGWRIWITAAWVVLLVPLAGMGWTGRLMTSTSWIVGTVALAAAASFAWQHDSHWLKWWAPLGRISYAVYVIHFPLMFAVGASALPAFGVVGFGIRFGAWALVTLAIAWLLELRLQPFLKMRLLPALRPAT